MTELAPGDYVVATVRRPGTSIYDLIGTNDMTTDDTYFERGINLRHGYLTEQYVDDADFIVKVYAAVVGPEPTVTRTSDCAVLTPDQLAPWIAGLPPQRTLTEGRRERVLEYVRDATR